MRARIWFTRSDDLGGWILRLFLMSKFNHVAIQIGETVYEATWAHGVLAHSPSQMKLRWKDGHRWRDVELPRPLEALRFLEAQVGKPYDWRSIVAFPLRISWHYPDAWFCSELVAEALIKSGLKLPLPTDRVTPRDVYFAIEARGL